MKRLPIGGIVALVVFVGACSAPSSGPGKQVATTTVAQYLPGLRDADCDFAGLPSDTTTIRCYSLSVPENRANPLGRQVEVPIAVRRLNALRRTPNPILVFSRDATRTDWGVFAALDRSTDTLRRDIIVFGARGTAEASPALVCPEAQAANDNRFAPGQPVEQRAFVNTLAMAACRARLAPTADLAHYSSVDVAADAVDVRKALGYPVVQVLAGGDGTSAALQFVERDPRAVRSATYVSPIPPDVALTLDAVADATSEAISNVQSACAADAQCAARYPALDTILRAVVDSLDRTPHLVTFPRADGSPRTVAISGSVLVLGIGTLLTNAGAIGALPTTIDQLRAGNFTIIDAFAPSLFGRTGGGDAVGAEYTRLCADRGSVANQPDFTAAIRARPWFADFPFYNCAVWNVAPVAPEQRQVRPTPVPTLVIDGRFDPTTTSAARAQFAAALGPKATTVEFPTLARAPLDASECARSILAAFTTDPTKAPATDCVAALPPVTWR